MKCTICGGRTLPGAKLCLPCRAALRRARDDTVSEFLPLPRRLEALAVSGMSTLSRPISIIAKRRARRRSRDATNVPSINVKLAPSYPPLRAAAIALFAMAVGVLAYGFAEQLRGDHQASLVPPDRPVDAKPVAQQTFVSPASLAAEARTVVMAPAEQPNVVPEQPAARAVAPPVVQHRPRKTAPAPSPLPLKVEAPTTTPVEVTPLVVAAAPAPPAPKVAPNRWQLLAAALDRCSGNLFARIACAHVARAQYCDGYWGQVTQCPAGVANDHGQ